MTAERPTTAAGGRPSLLADPTEAAVPPPVRAPTRAEGVRVVFRVFFGLFMGGLVTAAVMTLPATFGFDHRRMPVWLVLFAAAAVNLSLARGVRHEPARGWPAGFYWAAALDVVLGVIALVVV